MTYSQRCQLQVTEPYHQVKNKFFLNLTFLKIDAQSVPEADSGPDYRSRRAASIQTGPELRKRPKSIQKTRFTIKKKYLFNLMTWLHNIDRKLVPDNIWSPFTRRNCFPGQYPDNGSRRLPFLGQGYALATIYLRISFTPTAPCSPAHNPKHCNVILIGLSLPAQRTLWG